MAGLEIAAAITGIFQAVSGFDKLCRKYYRSFRKAPTEATRLCNLVEEFSETLDLFCRTANRMIEEEVDLAKDLKTESTVRRLRKMTKRSLREVRSVFRRIDIFGNDKYSTVQRLWARIQWLRGDEREMKELIASLNTAKLDIDVLVNLFSLNINLKIVAELRRIGQPITEYIVQEL